MSAVSWTLNGLTLNGSVGSGAVWAGSVSGLGGPGARYVAGDRVQASGQWSTRSYRRARAIGLKGTVRCRSVSEVPALLAALDDAVSLAGVPLTVHWPTGDQTIRVKRDGDIDVTDHSDTLIGWSCTMIAEDPNWYAGGPPDGSDPGLPDWPAGDVQTVTTNLPFTAGGMHFPTSFPFVFAGETSSGDVEIVTARGGLWGFEISVLAGASGLVNPRIVVGYPDGLVRELRWNLTLAAGERLVVDPQAQTSKLQGTASRPPVFREWPQLAPGRLIVQFRADSGGTITHTTPGPVVRTNFIRDPQFSIGVTEWGAYGNSSAPTWSTETLLAAADGSGAVIGTILKSAPWPVTAGKTIHVSARMRMVPGGQTPTGIRRRVACDGQTVNADATGWVPAGDGWVTTTFTAVVSAGVTGASCNVTLGVVLPTSGVSGTDLVEIDNVMVSDGAGSYFDGGSVDPSGDLTYEWSGQPNESWSVQRFPQQVESPGSSLTVHYLPVA